MTETEWIVDAKIPSFEDRYFFDVWIDNAVRRVRRVGNRGPLLWMFAPGTLVFSDCTHPAENMLCHEPRIDGWRLREDLPVPECREPQMSSDELAQFYYEAMRQAPPGYFYGLSDNPQSMLFRHRYPEDRF